MYEYPKLTPKQQAELVEHRLSLDYPAQAPPHPVKDRQLYLLSAAC
ncbi:MULTISPECIES: hypothetical protein [Nostocaceae]|nr:MULTISPECIES: hypothetical protein [Nostocaceae]